jgi:hypothetical protein
MRTPTQSHDGHGAFPVIVFERISDQGYGAVCVDMARASAGAQRIAADDARRAPQRAHGQARTERETLRTEHAEHIRQLRHAADEQAGALTTALHIAGQGAAVITKKTPNSQGTLGVTGGLKAPGVALWRLLPGGGRGGAAQVPVFKSVTVSF